MLMHAHTHRHRSMCLKYSKNPLLANEMRLCTHARTNANVRTLFMQSFDRIRSDRMQQQQQQPAAERRKRGAHVGTYVELYIIHLYAASTRRICERSPLCRRALRCVARRADCLRIDMSCVCVRGRIIITVVASTRVASLAPCEARCGPLLVCGWWWGR